MTKWLSTRGKVFQAFRADMFSSLHNPNYRRYFSGQAISLIGTWMQTIAQSYFVYKLTHSATDVGYVVALLRNDSGTSNRHIDRDPSAPTR